MATPRVLIFAAGHYWSDAGELSRAFDAVEESLRGIFADAYIEDITVIRVRSAEDLPVAGGGAHAGVGVFVPLSGAVQPLMLEAARAFSSVLVLPGYIVGFAPAPIAERALELNSAPASMDFFAVVRRTVPGARLVRSRDEAVARLRAWQGVSALRESTLLLVGEPEAWVISVSRDLREYEEAFGVTILQVDQSRLARIFQAVPEERARERAHDYLHGATELVEPTPEHVVRASRVVLAVEELMTRHGAAGLAIACFDLLPVLGTSSCLAVAMLNDSPHWIGACEGDLDAALTLMLVKAVTREPGWIANPNLQRDDTINFVHCTAALTLGGRRNRYRLRSHHESGIGVSPEVELPTGQSVTLARFGMEARELTVQRGTSQTPANERSCRTQLRVDLGGLDGYLEHVLGCHQVIVFADVRTELRYAAEYLGFRVTEPQTAAAAREV